MGFFVAPPGGVIKTPCQKLYARDLGTTHWWFNRNGSSLTHGTHLVFIRRLTEAKMRCCWWGAISGKTGGIYRKVYTILERVVSFEISRKQPNMQVLPTTNVLSFYAFLIGNCWSNRVIRTDLERVERVRHLSLLWRKCNRSWQIQSVNNKTSLPQNSAGPNFGEIVKV